MNYKNINKKNRLNCFMEISSNYKIEFHVNKNVFLPKPKVNSSIIKIIPKKNININLNNYEIFTRELFNNKRKKLSFFFKRTKFNTHKIDKDILDKRAEDLTIDEIKKIFSQYYN